MKAYLICLPILTYLFFSCNVKDKSTPELKSIQKRKVEDKSHLTGDTIYSKNDTIITFTKVNGNVGKFHWGVRNKFENTSKDTIPFNYFNRNQLKKMGDYSVFKDGCGSGCDYMFVMEFSKGKAGRLLMYPLLEAFKSNIIVYKGDDENDLLVVENLNTGKQQHIKEDYNKNLRPQTLAIDTLYLKDNEILFVKWQGSDSSKKNKSFKIE